MSSSNNLIPSTIIGSVIALVLFKLTNSHEKKKESFVFMPQELKKTFNEKERDIIEYESEIAEELVKDANEIENLQTEEKKDSKVFKVESLELPGAEDLPAVVYDRIYPRSVSSSQSSAGDYFRGDLPIKPIDTPLFRSRFANVENLNSGALSSIGGCPNEVDELKKKMNFKGGALGYQAKD